ncbi:MAG TPA: glycosyltransferase family 4 protein [Gemmataceae bacterium]|nr:glycosyltransferase family 4 protein [Gemmataceae bacterium]
MRALHVYAGNLFGGVENLLLTLARQRALCPAMEPSFALCFEGRLSAGLRESGAAVHSPGPVRVSRPWTLWRARRRLRRLLGQERPDVVIHHGCWPHAVFAPVARSRSVPFVFWAHDLPTGRHWLERWARRTRPDLVLANSRATDAALVRLFDDLPRAVLYCPVPAVRPDAGPNRARLRESLGTAPDSVVVLQASRLERWKGQALLLRALARLRHDPRWTCWLAGGPQRPAEAVYLAELRESAGDLGIAGRVRFLGERADVPGLLAAADIHCQPNTGPEPFGLAFVEALGAARPVVATALGGALEIIDDTCGLLVSPDALPLAEGLRRLIHDAGLRARLGSAGPARARALCDPARQIGRLYELLAGVVGRGRAA